MGGFGVVHLEGVEDVQINCVGEGGGIVCACKCGGGDVSRLFDLTPAQTDQTPIYTVRTQTMNKYTHLLHPHVGAPTRPSLTRSPTPPTHI